MPGKIKGLFRWCLKVTDGYAGVELLDMTSSWKNGLAFCAIINRFRPDLIDFYSLSADNVYENNDLAYSVMEREYNIVRLLDPKDMEEMDCPDRYSIATYVSSFYECFNDKPMYDPPPIPENWTPQKNNKKQKQSDKAKDSAKEQSKSESSSEAMKNNDTNNDTNAQELKVSNVHKSQDLKETDQMDNLLEESKADSVTLDNDNIDDLYAESVDILKAEEEIEKSEGGQKASYKNLCTASIEDIQSSKTGVVLQAMVMAGVTAVAATTIGDDLENESKEAVIEGISGDVQSEQLEGEKESLRNAIDNYKEPVSNTLCNTPGGHINSDTELSLNDADFNTNDSLTDSGCFMNSVLSATTDFESVDFNNTMQSVNLEASPEIKKQLDSSGKQHFDPLDPVDLDKISRETDKPAEQSNIVNPEEKFQEDAKDIVLPSDSESEKLNNDNQGTLESNDTEANDTAITKETVDVLNYELNNGHYEITDVSVVEDENSTVPCLEVSSTDSAHPVGRGMDRIIVDDTVIKSEREEILESQPNDKKLHIPDQFVNIDVNISEKGIDKTLKDKSPTDVMINTDASIYMATENGHMNMSDEKKGYDDVEGPVVAPDITRELVAESSTCDELKEPQQNILEVSTSKEIPTEAEGNDDEKKSDSQSESSDSECEKKFADTMATDIVNNVFEEIKSNPNMLDAETDIPSIMKEIETDFEVQNALQNHEEIELYEIQKLNPELQRISPSKPEEDEHVEDKCFDKRNLTEVEVPVVELCLISNRKDSFSSSSSRDSSNGKESPPPPALPLVGPPDLTKFVTDDFEPAEDIIVESVTAIESGPSDYFVSIPSLRVDNNSEQCTVSATEEEEDHVDLPVQKSETETSPLDYVDLAVQKTETSPLDHADLAVQKTETETSPLSPEICIETTKMENDGNTEIVCPVSQNSPQTSDLNVDFSEANMEVSFNRINIMDDILVDQKDVRLETMAISSFCDSELPQCKGDTTLGKDGDTALTRDQNMFLKQPEVIDEIISETSVEKLEADVSASLLSEYKSTDIGQPDEKPSSDPAEIIKLILPVKEGEETSKEVIMANEESLQDLQAKKKELQSDIIGEPSDTGISSDTENDKQIEGESFTASQVNKHECCEKQVAFNDPYISLNAENIKNEKDATDNDQISEEIVLSVPLEKNQDVETEEPYSPNIVNIKNKDEAIYEEEKLGKPCVTENNKVYGDNADLSSDMHAKLNEPKIDDFMEAEDAKDQHHEENKFDESVKAVPVRIGEVKLDWSTKVSDSNGNIAKEVSVEFTAPISSDGDSTEMPEAEIREKTYAEIDKDLLKRAALMSKKMAEKVTMKILDDQKMDLETSDRTEHFKDEKTLETPLTPPPTPEISKELAKERRHTMYQMLQNSTRPTKKKFDEDDYEKPEEKNLDFAAKMKMWNRRSFTGSDAGPQRRISLDNAPKKRISLSSPFLSSENTSSEHKDTHMARLTKILPDKPAPGSVAEYIRKISEQKSPTVEESSGFRGRFSRSDSDTHSESSYDGKDIGVNRPWRERYYYEQDSKEMIDKDQDSEQSIAKDVKPSSIFAARPLARMRSKNQNVKLQVRPLSVEVMYQEMNKDTDAAKPPIPPTRPSRRSLHKVNIDVKPLDKKPQSQDSTTSESEDKDELKRQDSLKKKRSPRRSLSLSSPTRSNSRSNSEERERNVWVENGTKPPSPKVKRSDSFEIKVRPVTAQKSPEEKAEAKKEKEFARQRSLQVSQRPPTPTKSLPKLDISVKPISAKEQTGSNEQIQHEEPRLASKGGRRSLLSLIGGMKDQSQVENSTEGNETGDILPGGTNDAEIETDDALDSHKVDEIVTSSDKIAPPKETGSRLYEVVKAAVKSDKDQTNQITNPTAVINEVCEDYKGISDSDSGIATVDEEMIPKVTAQVESAVLVNAEPSQDTKYDFHQEKERTIKKCNSIFSSGKPKLFETYQIAQDMKTDQAVKSGTANLPEEASIGVNHNKPSIAVLKQNKDAKESRNTSTDSSPHSEEEEDLKRKRKTDKSEASSSSDESSDDDTSKSDRSLNSSAEIDKADIKDGLKSIIKEIEDEIHTHEANETEHQDKTCNERSTVLTENSDLDIMTEVNEVNKEVAKMAINDVTPDSKTDIENSDFEVNVPALEENIVKVAPSLICESVPTKKIDNDKNDDNTCDALTEKSEPENLMAVPQLPPVKDQHIVFKVSLNEKSVGSEKQPETSIDEINMKPAAETKKPDNEKIDIPVNENSSSEKNKDYQDKKNKKKKTRGKCSDSSSESSQSDTDESDHDDNSEENRKQEKKDEAPRPKTGSEKVTQERKISSESGKSTGSTESTTTTSEDSDIPENIQENMKFDENISTHDTDISNDEMLPSFQTKITFDMDNSVMIVDNINERDFPNDSKSNKISKEYTFVDPKPSDIESKFGSETLFENIIQRIDEPCTSESSCEDIMALQTEEGPVLRLVNPSLLSEHESDTETLTTDIEPSSVHKDGSRGEGLDVKDEIDRKLTDSSSSSDSDSDIKSVSSTNDQLDTDKEFCEVSETKEKTLIECSVYNTLKDFTSEEIDLIKERISAPLNKDMKISDTSSSDSDSHVTESEQILEDQNQFKNDRLPTLEVSEENVPIETPNTEPIKSLTKPDILHHLPTHEVHLEAIIDDKSKTKSSESSSDSSEDDEVITEGMMVRKSSTSPLSSSKSEVNDHVKLMDSDIQRDINVDGVLSDNTENKILADDVDYFKVDMGHGEHNDNDAVIATPDMFADKFKSPSSTSSSSSSESDIDETNKDIKLHDSSIERLPDMLTKTGTKELEISTREPDDKIEIDIATKNNTKKDSDQPCLVQTDLLVRRKHKRKSSDSGKSKSESSSSDAGGSSDTCKDTGGNTSKIEKEPKKKSRKSKKMSRKSSTDSSKSGEKSDVRDKNDDRVKPPLVEELVDKKPLDPPVFIIMKEKGYHADSESSDSENGWNEGTKVEEVSSSSSSENNEKVKVKKPISRSSSSSGVSDEESKSGRGPDFKETKNEANYKRSENEGKNESPQNIQQKSDASSCSSPCSELDDEAKSKPELFMPVDVTVDKNWCAPLENGTNIEYKDEVVKDDPEKRVYFEITKQKLVKEKSKSISSSTSSESEEEIKKYSQKKSNTENPDLKDVPGDERHVEIPPKDATVSSSSSSSSSESDESKGDHYHHQLDKYKELISQVKTDEPKKIKKIENEEISPSVSLCELDKDDIDFNQAEKNSHMEIVDDHLESDVAVRPVEERINKEKPHTSSSSSSSDETDVEVKFEKEVFEEWKEESGVESLKNVAKSLSERNKGELKKHDEKSISRNTSSSSSSSSSDEDNKICKKSSHLGEQETVSVKAVKDSEPEGKELVKSPEVTVVREKSIISSSSSSSESDNEDINVNKDILQIDKNNKTESEDRISEKESKKVKKKEVKPVCVDKEKESKGNSSSSSSSSSDESDDELKADQEIDMADRAYMDMVYVDAVTADKLEKEIILLPQQEVTEVTRDDYVESRDENKDEVVNEVSLKTGEKDDPEPTVDTERISCSSSSSSSSEYDDDDDDDVVISDIEDVSLRKDIIVGPRPHIELQKTGDTIPESGTFTNDQAHEDVKVGSFETNNDKPVDEIRENAVVRKASESSSSSSEEEKATNSDLETDEPEEMEQKSFDRVESQNDTDIIQDITGGIEDQEDDLLKVVIEDSQPFKAPLLETMITYDTKNDEDNVGDMQRTDSTDDLYTNDETRTDKDLYLLPDCNMIKTDFDDISLKGNDLPYNILDIDLQPEPIDIQVFVIPDGPVDKPLTLDTDSKDVIVLDEEKIKGDVDYNPTVMVPLEHMIDVEEKDQIFYDGINNDDYLVPRDLNEIVLEPVSDMSHVYRGKEGDTESEDEFLKNIIQDYERVPVRRRKKSTSSSSSSSDNDVGDLENYDQVSGMEDHVYQSLDYEDMPVDKQATSSGSEWFEDGEIYEDIDENDLSDVENRKKRRSRKSITSSSSSSSDEGKGESKQDNIPRNEKGKEKIQKIIDDSKEESLDTQKDISGEIDQDKRNCDHDIHEKLNKNDDQNNENGFNDKTDKINKEDSEDSDSSSSSSSSDSEDEKKIISDKKDKQLIKEDIMVHPELELVESQIMPASASQEFAPSPSQQGVELESNFMIGREKDPSKSEVARLIQQSLDLDRKREELRRQEQERLQEQVQPRDEVLEKEHQKHLADSHLQLEREEENVDLDESSIEDEVEAEEKEISEGQFSEEYQAGEATPMSMPSGVDTDNSVSSPEDGPSKPVVEVFDLQESSSEDVSPDMESQALFVKLKEAQCKIAVLEAEVAKLKARLIILENSEAQKKQLEKKNEEMAARLRETEKALTNARKEINHYQDLLEGSQGQYIKLEKKMSGDFTALEKKYHKAKKLIKEYQQREKDFLAERESLLQQQTEKDQRYNALVKSLKDKIFLLEGDLREAQKAAGLPVLVQSQEPTTPKAEPIVTPVSVQSVKSAPPLHDSGSPLMSPLVDKDSASSESEVSSADPVTPEAEIKLEKVNLFESMPVTQPLDTSVNKAKAQAANNSRRPPTKQRSKSQDSDDLMENAPSNKDESGLETWIKHDSDNTVKKSDVRKRKAQQQGLEAQSSPSSTPKAEPSSPQSVEVSVTEPVPTDEALPPPPPPPSNPPTSLPESDLNDPARERRDSESGDSSSTVSQSSYDPTKPNFRNMGSEIPCLDSGTPDSVNTHDTESESSSTSAKKSKGFNLPKLPFKLGGNEKDKGGVMLISSRSLNTGEDTTSVNEGGITLITKRKIDTGVDFDGASTISTISDTSSSGYMVGEQESTSYTFSGTPANEDHPSQASPHVQNQFQSCAISEWNVEHVRNWLIGIEMDKYIPLFTDKSVTGLQLVNLDANKMKTIGISNSKDRDFLKKKVKELKLVLEKERKQQEKERKQQEKEQKAKEKEQKKMSRKK